jgi:hypothetical protein
MPSRKIIATLIAPVLSPVVLLLVGWLQLLSLKDCGPGCAGGVGLGIVLWYGVAAVSYVGFGLVCWRAASRLEQRSALTFHNFVRKPIVYAAVITLLLTVLAFGFSTPDNFFSDIAFVVSPMIITASVCLVWWLIASPHNPSLKRGGEVPFIR